MNWQLSRRKCKDRGTRPREDQKPKPQTIPQKELYRRWRAAVQNLHHRSFLPFSGGSGRREEGGNGSGLNSGVVKGEAEDGEEDVVPCTVDLDAGEEVLGVEVWRAHGWLWKGDAVDGLVVGFRDGW